MYRLEDELQQFVSQHRFWRYNFDRDNSFPAGSADVIRGQIIPDGRCLLCGRSGRVYPLAGGFSVCLIRHRGCLHRIAENGDGVLGIIASALERIFEPHDSIRLHMVQNVDHLFFIRLAEFIQPLGKIEALEDYYGVWGDWWYSLYIEYGWRGQRAHAQVGVKDFYMTEKPVRLLGQGVTDCCDVCQRDCRNGVEMHRYYHMGKQSRVRLCNDMGEWSRGQLCNFNNTGCLQKVMNRNLSFTEIQAGALLCVFAPWDQCKTLLTHVPYFFLMIMPYLEENLHSFSDWIEAFLKEVKRLSPHEELPGSGNAWYQQYVLPYLSDPRSRVSSKRMYSARVNNPVHDVVFGSQRPPLSTQTGRRTQRTYDLAFAATNNALLNLSRNNSSSSS